MIDCGIVNGNWSGKKMEGEDGLRTLECLRGRLLAERVSSRIATENADHMENIVMEIENQLRVEIKSRNRAEKKLKLVLKKLESLNISFGSEESEHSSFMEKSEISSVSSKEPDEDKDPKTQITNPEKCEIEESVVKKRNCPVVSQDLEDNNVSSNQACSEEHSEVEWSQNCNDPKTYDLSSSILRCLVEKGDINGGSNDQAEDDYVDNSLALVPIDLQKATTQPIDPPIVNASVKEVLDALRHAREKLQWSMERRHILQAGSK
ncbi:hypothetical protein ACSBR2_034958 [Camellia fascicularis]